MYRSVIAEISKVQKFIKIRLIFSYVFREYVIKCSKRSFCYGITLGPVWNCIFFVYIKHVTEFLKEF
ncbi:unnamed protein product [Meloidogyne enterolobii]|uniref:Uncharacterized protein n=1 Tax=Meloidogyne enterolobii TaxID=390850 RepID=A0ACB0ZM57_MELEN